MEANAVDNPDEEVELVVVEESETETAQTEKYPTQDSRPSTDSKSDSKTRRARRSRAPSRGTRKLEKRPNRRMGTARPRTYVSSSDSSESDSDGESESDSSDSSSASATDSVSVSDSPSRSRRPAPRNRPIKRTRATKTTIPTSARHGARKKDVVDTERGRRERSVGSVDVNIVNTLLMQELLEKIEIQRQKLEMDLQGNMQIHRNPHTTRNPYEQRGRGYTRGDSGLDSRSPSRFYGPPEDPRHRYSHHPRGPPHSSHKEHHPRGPPHSHKERSEMIRDSRSGGRRMRMEEESSEMIFDSRNGHNVRDHDYRPNQVADVGTPFRAHHRREGQIRDRDHRPKSVHKKTARADYQHERRGGRDQRRGKDSSRSKGRGKGAPGTKSRDRSRNRYFRGMKSYSLEREESLGYGGRARLIPNPDAEKTPWLGPLQRQATRDMLCGIRQNPAMRRYGVSDATSRGPSPVSVREKRFRTKNERKDQLDSRNERGSSPKKMRSDLMRSNLTNMNTAVGTKITGAQAQGRTNLTNEGASVQERKKERTSDTIHKKERNDSTTDKKETRGETKKPSLKINSTLTCSYGSSWQFPVPASSPPMKKSYRAAVPVHKTIEHSEQVVAAVNDIPDTIEQSEQVVAAVNDIPDTIEQSEQVVAAVNDTLERQATTLENGEDGRVSLSSEDEAE